MSESTRRVKTKVVLPSRRYHVLPSETAEMLRAMDRREQSVYMIRLIDKGWTYQSIADVMGFSRQAIEQRVAKAREQGLVASGLPPVPPTPVREVERTRFATLPEDVIASLREMQQVARTVNGGTRSDDPRREVAVQFTARLVELVEEGWTLYYLAQVLGVTHAALHSRLGRHGYKEIYPSQAHNPYKGRATYEALS